MHLCMYELSLYYSGKFTPSTLRRTTQRKPDLILNTLFALLAISFAALNKKIIAVPELPFFLRPHLPGTFYFLQITMPLKSRVYAAHRY